MSAGPSLNQKLMKKIGAKSSSPMPPEQHAFFLTDSQTDVNRFVAWVWEGTIKVGHPTKGFGPRSPYCVDEKGKPLRVEDAADYFGWEPAYARRMQRRAKAQGRIRTDDHRRIWLCGEVVPCEVPEDPDEAEKPGVDDRQQKDCTRYVPAYILLKTSNWEKDKLARFRREEGALADVYDRRLADAATQLRAIRDQQQDTRWQAYKLPPRRKIDAAKKKNPAGPLTVQLTLLDVTGEDAANPPYPVQSSENERTVQSQNAAPVQSSYPLVPTENYQTTTGAGVAARVKEHVVVVDQLRERGIGWVGAPAAQKILDECRKLLPECTVEEVAAVTAKIAPTINQRTQKNPTGVLIRAVPQQLVEHRQSAKESPMVTLPGMRPMLRAEAIALLEQVGRDESDPESQRAALERLAVLQGKGASHA